MSGKQEQPDGEVIVYRTEDGRNRILVRLQEETVWLTQAMLADLYETSVPNINIHIRNVLEEGELSAEATIKEYLIVRQEGSRQVQRPVKYYNLDMILAVGYRVRSPRGVLFRQWATERLREYLVKGFTLDDERLKGRDRLVVMFLDQAEFRAQRRQDIRMRDWETILDKFLRDTELPVLTDAGSVRHEQAQTWARGQYDDLAVRRRIEAEETGEANYLEDLRASAKTLERQRGKGRSVEKKAGRRREKTGGTEQ